jgi:hypothetical protein
VERLTHEEQSKSGASVSSSLEEDLGQGLASDGTGDGRDIAQGKHDDDQEGETEGGTTDQSFCYLNARTAYLSMTPYTLFVSNVGPEKPRSTYIARGILISGLMASSAMEGSIPVAEKQ